MAARKEATEFNAIIKAEREKKKKQQLADKIFGSGRRSSAPGTGNGKRPPTGPSSLASRVGVSKPSASPRTSVNGKKRTNDTRPAIQRAVSTPQLNQRNHQRNQALTNVLNGGGRDQVNVVHRQANGSGISIRGASTTTYTVMAQNFALGTTAADIEAVLVPDAAEAGLVRCRLVASNPTVIAELVLTNKDIAENIIATYNNKKADGRLLYVYMKDPPPSMQSHRVRAAPSRAPAPVITVDDDDDEMDYDDEQQSRSQRQLRTATRAEPDFQDGRYGFSETDYRTSENSYQDYRQNDGYNRRGRGGNATGGSGLVSDGMLRRDDDYYRR